MTKKKNTDELLPHPTIPSQMLPSVDQMGEILKVALLFRESLKSCDRDRSFWVQNAVKMTGTNAPLAIESMYYAASGATDHLEGESLTLAYWLYGLLIPFHQEKSVSELAF